MRKATKTTKATTKSKARTPVKAATTKAAKGGSKAAELHEWLCKQKNGATNEQLCKQIGWGQCLPALRKECDRHGTKFWSEKKAGEPTRYFGKAKAS